MSVDMCEYSMETPKQRVKGKCITLSPPPPPGGFEPCEIAKCEFPEFIPSHPHEPDQLPVHCILNKNLSPRRQKSNSPSKVDLSELSKNPNLLLLPVLDKSSSHTKDKVSLNIRPRAFPSPENEFAEPLALMKAFVKQTYALKMEDQAPTTPKTEAKSTTKRLELTEVFLKQGYPGASQHTEAANKLGGHMDIGRAIHLSSSRQKRQVRRSYAALGA